MVAGAVVLGLVCGAVLIHQRLQVQHAQAAEAGRIAVAQASAVSASLVRDVAGAKRLLAESDGKVIEPVIREKLAVAIADAEAALGRLDESAAATGASDAPERLNRLRTVAMTERKDLATAVEAVQASAHRFDAERARTAAEAAGVELAAAMTAGEKVVVESEGQVADGAVLRTLRDALDAAADVRDVGLDGMDPARLSELTVRRGEARARVDHAAREVTDARAAWRAEQDHLASQRKEAAAVAAGWHDAASREHCAAPDQVWSPENGHISDEELAAIPWAPRYRVRADVLDGLVGLDAAFQERFGRHLEISSAYRTHAQQTSLYDPGSRTAAPPGCSNHGTGLAVDIGGGAQRFGTTEYEWLKAHADEYGWVHPPFAEPGGRNPEPWHWQSVLAPNSR